MLLFAASQSLTALTIGAGAIVTLTNPVPAPPDFPDLIEGLVSGFDANGGPKLDGAVVLVSGTEGDDPSLLQEGSNGGDFGGNPLSAVPEPGGMSLLLLGALGLLGRRFRAKS